MINYNKRSITIYSIIITIIVYIFIQMILSSFNFNQKKEKSSVLVLKTSNVNPIVEVSKDKQINNFFNSDNENKYSKYDWRIIISKINLNAPILEGTSKETLRKGVGHFEKTSSWNGNVCLAAHNRGYKYNYFQELKKLEIGDRILYQKQEESREYKVCYKEKIMETDLSKIEETKENRITLITCVENMPEYRLCIQAEEIKKG